MSFAILKSWSPHFQQDINVLEAVQQRTVRMISGLKRRISGDMIQTYKILHKVDYLPVSTFFRIAGANHNHVTQLGPNDLTISTLNLGKPTHNVEATSIFFKNTIDQMEDLYNKGDLFNPFLRFACYNKSTCHNRKEILGPKSKN